MNLPRLRWGLMGASDIAESRMLPALHRTDQRVTALLSASPAHSTAFARRTGIPAVENDLAAFVARGDVDAVYISSTNEQHLEHVRAAAAAGLHVLCEKPVALTLDEADAITAICREAGVTLAINHHLPAAGTHQRVRKLVDAGGIGRPLSVGISHATLLPERLRGWRLSASPGAGAVMDLTCHDASVTNALLARPALEVSAITVRQGPWSARSEDAAMAVIRYEDEVLVRTHDAFTAPFTPTVLEVHGDEGSIRAVGVMTPEPTGTVELIDRQGAREIEVEDRRHTYDITLQAFIRACQGDGAPVVTGEAAADALALSLAVLESQRTG